MSNPRTDIVLDALERFPTLPTKTIARRILAAHGPMFDNNLEVVRSVLRYYEGKNGEKNRKARKRTNRIALPPTQRKKLSPYYLPEGLWLCLFDIHIPFHEPFAVEAAVKYGQKNGVTGVYFGGDAQDCDAISFWRSDRKRDFDKEVEDFVDFLDWIEKEFPKAKKVFKKGNHEQRLDRYYQTKAPELIGLVSDSMDTVLALEYRGIDTVDEGQKTYAGKLPVIHGHEIRKRATLVNPARTLFLATKSWALCGHYHRTSEHPERDIKGTYLTTWSVGCLCNLDPDYIPVGSNWNHGFCLINVEKGGNFEVINKRILPNGTVV